MLVLTPAHARTPSRAAGALALTAELEEANFSGTVRVTHRGRLIVHRSFGLADRAFGVPVGKRTRFRVASISKLFTSVAILRLAEQGAIDLDTPFRQYFSEYPGTGAEQVTVRQLLGHMSGLPQSDTVASFDEAIANGLPLYQQLRSPRQLLDLCCARAPAAAPGERFDYNNADYILLGLVIESVTGESYFDAVDRLVLQPAGLRDTRMALWSEPVPLLAQTYYRRPGGTQFDNELPFFWDNAYAAGGLYSTTMDIARFSDALFEGRLLSPASMAELMRPGGDEYGLGLWSYSFSRKGVSHRVAKRPGSIMGANAMLYRLPDDGLSIVILANSNAVELDGLAQRIADAALDGRAIQ
jgi:D-alanyl-D-alanine carboxypeptidase